MNHSEAPARPNFEWEYRAHRAGLELAAYDVMRRCQALGLHPPAWAINAMLDVFEQAHLKKPSRRKGRTANAVARLRADVIDLIRFSRVTGIYAERELYRASLKAADDPALTGEERLERQQWLATYMGPVKGDAFQLAADNLANTPARGTSSAMRRSYERMKRREEDPDAPPGFEWLSPETLTRMLGQDFFSFMSEPLP